MSTNSDPEPALPRDRRAQYALLMQQACSYAIDRVKDNEFIANSSWAAHLTATSSAISTMTILLGAAGQRAATGLEVESQDVIETGGEGQVVGKFPSMYFHTNLQHCADVGRLAFLDAQNAMSIIRSTALRMIATRGSIEYILKLLEDPEDAKDNLKPEMETIQRTAQKCLENAQQITAKFQYWHCVILGLKLASLTKRGKIIIEKEANSTQRAREKEEERRETDVKRYFEDRIEILKDKIRDRQGRFGRKEEEAQLVREFDALCDEMFKTRDDLVKTNARLEKARNEVQRLEERDLELQGILGLLENSARDLGHLKENIEDLVLFSQTMLRQIQNSVEHELNGFLSPIERGITHGSTPEKIEALQISKYTKKRLMTAALQMQGQFSIIADISSAYVAISTDYIRPSINEMERLSATTESEWAVESKHFLEKCAEWLRGIEDVTRTTSKRLENNAMRNINQLRMRAVEAAAGCY